MRVLAALAVPALVLLARPARAGDDGLRLTWTAPAECPDVEDVRSATLRGAGARQAKSEDVLEADARVERRKTGDASGWSVRLHTRRGATTGEREIVASTCSGVAEATAVVLALALVPPAAEADEHASAASPPARETAASPAPAVRQRDHEHALAIGASAAADASSLPSAAAGGSLTFAWLPRRVRVELDARRWVSQSRTLASSDAGARFSMTSLGGRGCWAAIRTNGLELAPCAGADVHLVSAPGYGADANYSSSAAWTAITGGWLGRLSLASWLALRARVEGSVPLTHPTFVVRNEGMVHRPAAVGAAASFGVEALFL